MPFAGLYAFLCWIAISAFQYGSSFGVQVDREKQVPAVQLNVIRLLADLNVAVKKPDVADMILPLFIESLEEGDASTPSFLRLQVWFQFLQC